VLLEVVQTKGQSETAPFLSPNDEFADFGVWDKMNLAGTKAHQESFYQNEYVRAALKKGLEIEQRLGVNPFKLGMIGGTDQHIGITAIEEDNYFGVTPMDEPKADRWKGVFQKLAGTNVAVMNWEMTAAGYGAIWASENTRASLWDAMKRKETYATTGPRIFVRFFGGFDFEEADANTRSPAIAGYTKGVPMGGDLGPAPEGKAPTFLVAALKDPIGANLDRYQIVKGWMDESGETAREGLRCRVVGRPTARRRWKAAFHRQHRGRGRRHLDQYDRRAGVDRGVGRPRFRSRFQGLLLRPRLGDSDAPLDDL
jgi:hypothetical protein